MRSETILLALATLWCFAWAADNAAVGATPTANNRSPITELQSLDDVTIPQLLSYQGKLTDSLGVPAADTTYSVVFKLYTVPTGGSAFWNETQTVTTRSGLFSTLLGSVTPIGSIPDGGAVYLGMTVSGGSELTPRLRIVSAAYSYLAGRAANADLLQGRDTTTFSRSTHNHDAAYVNEGQTDAVTSGMLVNGTIAAADLGQMGASSGQVMKWTGSAWAPRNDSVGSGGAGDNAWVRIGSDSVIYTIRKLGLARGGSSNVLRGSRAYTHVNFGIACSTGSTSGNDSFCTMSGGWANKALGSYSAAGGGFGNLVSGACATVGGGYGDSASDYYATVGGGYRNNAGYAATVAGGSSNRASGNDAAVGGGALNTASASYAVVGGGYFNAASADHATVGGGLYDTAKALCGGALSGYGNLAGDASLDSGAVVAGGWHNRAIAQRATVSGGQNNTASQYYSTVAGGRDNFAAGYLSSIGGGDANLALGSHSTVGGGAFDSVTAGWATVGGGGWNCATADYATVAGGRYNAAGAWDAVVGGGAYDTVKADWGGVLSGRHNLAGTSTNDTGACVVGGYNNSATDLYSFVGGGRGNIAGHQYTTVCGGQQNTADWYWSAVGGGQLNRAWDQCATVPGGYADSAEGPYSFATNNHSVVATSYSNSAAFNGQAATASNQLRCGTLSKTGGSFSIDHPLDPRGKILNHYFVESPDMSNLYSGSVMLDGSGRAEVQLPDYFDALNRNPRVQLTGVGTSDVFVAEDISGNRFAVGGRPGAKVYWQVTGDRRDASAEAIRRMMPVEQPKSGELAGRMLDDDFLVGCMGQLEREGKAQGIDFRTPAARVRYEKVKQDLREAGQK